MPGLAEVLKALGFATPFIYAYATYRFFHWLDTKASGPAKKAISGWLQPKEYDKAAIAAAILEILDRVYTRPLLAWRAFLRSALITITISTILIYEFHGLSEYDDFSVSDVLGSFAGLYDYRRIRIRLTYLLISIALNVLLDYAALFVIKQWLFKATLSPVKALLVGPVFGLTLVASFIAVRDVAGLFLLHRGRISLDLIELWLVSNLGNLPYRALTLSALAVHLWLPFFALCVGLLKGLNYVLLATKQVQWFIKQGRQHPLDALGLVAAPLVFLIAVAVQWLVSE